MNRSRFDKVLGIIIAFSFISLSPGKEDFNTTTSTNSGRISKFLNLFSVIRFSNEPCIGNNGRNGTCYTEKQCRDKGGVESGSCAGGFGVCCVFSIGCGETTIENTTYVSTDTSSSECVYTICRCNEKVNLLRLDFTEFEIASPFECGGSTATVTCTTNDGPKHGDCYYDSFTVSTPGSVTPPTICGYNTGQHMYVDSSSQCNKLTFLLDLSTSSTRNWQIKITQYDEHDDSRYLPPPDCLQWNTGTLGTVQNFNFKDSSSIHLSSQRYSICWRRERNRCSLCFSIGYFGMSNVPSSVSGSSWTRKAGFTDQICGDQDTPVANAGTSGANDYIEIDQAAEPPISNRFENGDGNRFCGRWFGISTSAPSYQYSATNAAKTICTTAYPFRMRVRFSDGETFGSPVCGNGRTSDISDECSAFRLYGKRKGTLGFQLVWWQTDC